MWPVVVGPGASNWVGYLGQASFALNNDVGASSDKLLAHLDWRTSGTSEASRTGSTGQPVAEPEVCYFCEGESPRGSTERCAQKGIITHVSRHR